MTTGLFPKTFVDDVDIVFVLPVTICWGVCEQVESQLCFKDTGWGILVKKLAIFLQVGCLKLTPVFLNKVAVEHAFYISFTFFCLSLQKL